jgi:hypothetical protein
MKPQTNRRLFAAFVGGVLLEKTLDLAIEPIKGAAGEWGKRQYAGPFGLNPKASVDEEALLGALDLTRDSLPPQIIAGEGNAIGVAQGKGISRYLKEATSELATHLTKTLSLQSVVVDSNESDAFAYKRNKAAVFLGGPPSNATTAALMGYTHIDVVEDGLVVKMPIPDPLRRVVRWAPIYGHTAYGEYNGKFEVAARLDSKGNPVERPLYKVLDRITGDILTPIVSNGALMSEWLSITRLVEAGKPKIIIGGLHGHSLNGFFSELAKNLHELAVRVAFLKSYQLLIPVDLQIVRDLTGKQRVAADLLWKNSRLEILPADA